MKKTLQSFSKYLPVIVLVLLVFAPISAHAGIFDFVDRIVDNVVQAAANAVLKKLGIDTELNCSEPRPHQICLFCDMFKVLFNAGSKVAETAYSIFSTDLGRLIIVFLAVSLALMILRNVASMGSKDPAALLNDIMRKTFVCIAIYIIVTKDYYNTLNLTIVPVIKDSLSLVGNVGGASLSFEACSYAAEINGFVDSVGAAISGHEAGIPKSIGDMIICSVDDVERKIYNMFEYGRWAFCRGNGPDRLFHVMPHPIYIIDGLFLYLGGIFFMVAYPWVMADAVLQLGISLAVLPFAVAGYAFKGTKNYLTKAFSWILNSMFVFIFMGILLECLLSYINMILVKATENLADPKELFLNPNTGIAFFGPNMMMIIFVLVIAYAYMPTIKDLAENFASGSSLSAASKVGSMVTNKMEEKAEQLGQYTLETAAKAAETGARVGKRRFKAGVRQILLGSTNTFGQDDGSGNKSFSFAGIKFTAEKNADGESVLKREYTSITGRKHVMISDKYSTIKQEYTASGRLIKDEVTFKHNFVNKHLYNKDGTINMGALQTLLDSPIGKNPAYRQSIMSQLAIKSLKDQGKNIGTYFRSRQITFDPNHPEKIFIEQIDYSGKVTKISMNIDMQTGQTAVSYATKRDKTGDYEVYFKNGAVEFNIKGKQDSSGRILSEKTKFKYSDAAQAGHDSILDKSNGNQVVEGNGSIAADLQKYINGDPSRPNPLYLLHGLDDVFGVTNIGGMSVSDFMVQNVFASGRRMRTNLFRTLIGNAFI